MARPVRFSSATRPLAALLAVTALAAGGARGGSAEGAPPAPRGVWAAKWIAAPGAAPAEYGVYHFRRAIELEAPPAAFPVRVSADNRYELFVNGRRAASGPARGDLAHWRYETVDLAPFLARGRNVLAAVVWNFGGLAPAAQVSREAAFLLEAEVGHAADTGEAWVCMRDEAYAPVPVRPQDVLNQYYVAGPGDRVDGARYPWGWERPEYDDSTWERARVVGPAAARGAADPGSPWMLVPRGVPAMEERPERLAAVRESAGVAVPAGFPARPGRLEVPARSTARLLLDNGTLTTAYPELVLAGGAGATATLRYAESLFVPGAQNKGNRDEVEGKEVRGPRDVFVADGGRGRLFRPLWWRTYRYLELTVETAGEPLVVEDLRAVFTAYPFERRARFDAGRPELDRILDVGWRTARLCAHETYMDCPYYEQLQYVGDTRVQALVSLFMSGDDRLMRGAIEQIDDSRTAEGLTLSRTPTSDPQYIPPFSLWWVGMVHDFWWYRDDPAFVRARLPGVRAVLSFFESRRRPGGLLGPVPWWNFVDWAEPWPAGTPPGTWAAAPAWQKAPAGASDGDLDGPSALLDLQLLLAYDWAADLEEAVGSPDLARDDRAAAASLRAAIRGAYWDGRRGLLADTPERRRYSQQANALAVLAGVTSGAEARAVMERALADTSLVRASVYFRYYVNAALARAGMGDLYLEQLGPWSSMLDQRLTTWAEIADPATRSDCHAWGASPNVELFRTVLGIDSAAPGFRRVVVRPALGPLARASGTVPHPRGEVAVRLSVEGGRLTAEVDLPPGVEGELVWRGATRRLPPGRSRAVL